MSRLAGKPTRAAALLVACVLLGIATGPGCDEAEVPPRPDLINHQNLTPIEVTGFTPARGLAGDVVTIAGTGFASDPEMNRAYIGGAAVPIVSGDDSTIVTTVPVYAANGAIRVTDYIGRVAGSSEDVFEVRVPEHLFVTARVLRLGYVGDPGQPVISWSLPLQHSVTGTQTAIFISGDVTDADGDGYWAIVDDEGFVRSQGVLPLNGIDYLQELPLFCGTQWVVLYFDNAQGRAFHVAEITRSDCDEVGLRVKLSWDTDGTDVDLHLLRPGAGYTTDGDCYYANSRPDWGVIGDPSDDPFLDVDDVDGFGPENISLDPGEDGRYQVTVHYFSDHDVVPPASNAWVEIFIDGLRVASFGPKTLTQTGFRWNACTIDWPSGNVEAILY